MRNSLTWAHVARYWLLVGLVLTLLSVIASLHLGRASKTLADTGNTAPSGSPTPGSAPALSDASRWRKQWWIDRTAKLLRGGEGLGPDDAVGELLPLSKESIARRFMQDPRFGDTMVDFNLFFLGFKSDHLKSDGIYDRTVFDFPNAIAAAQSLLKGGDYFTLFDLEGPFYMAPLRNDFSDEPPPATDAGLTPAALRKKAMGDIEAVFADALTFAEGKPAPRLPALCTRVEALADSADHLTPQLHRAFDDAEIFALIRGEVVAAPLEMLASVAEKACNGATPAVEARKALVEGLQRALAAVRRTFSAMAAFEPDVYQPRSVLDFKRFDLSAFPTKQKWLSFGYEQGMALANSSTNFNRKRAAYILKHFFCDDLIPIGFETPQEHVGGAHGSQTSCFACHHKLDPMAGFFRAYGAYFFDYSRSPDIVFDDLATKMRTRYEAVWKSASKTQPGWNVGYIRSARWQSYNSYGTSMGDLSRILRTAPEVKRCLVRRLHEYIVAEDQSIDRGYLEHLTRTFEAEAAENSSAAVKNTIVRILQSAAYDERNADPKRCYDAAPETTGGERPPCRVAFILSRNCSQCHNAGSEDEAARLDVDTWIAARDGDGGMFRHVDSKMSQLSPRDSLT
ncbi:MAG TPA: hypothetical protein VJ740_09100, partial [Hyphomicrobiaceae bacterium]|nr:hypothetical protein [Hyphomicrobiaceae bacterium]